MYWTCNQVTCTKLRTGHHSSRDQSKFSILIGVISSATSNFPTSLAKNTIICSKVNLMFSACSKSRKKLQNPCRLTVSKVLRVNISIQWGNNLAEPMLLSFIFHQSNRQPFLFQGIVYFACLIWWHNLENIEADDKLCYRNTDILPSNAAMINITVHGQQIPYPLTLETKWLDT